MHIILLERVEKLGQMGDVVKVKDGFARNYLLPQKKALRATAANREQFEQQRAGLEKTNAVLRTDAEKNASALDGKTCILLRQASESGQLYGSVSARDVAEAASSLGVEIERRQVSLDRAIKHLGVYPVRVFLHPEVPTTVQVIVARSETEAEVAKQRLAAGGGGAGIVMTGGDAAKEAEAFFEEGVAPATTGETEGSTEATDEPKRKKRKAKEAAEE